MDHLGELAWSIFVVVLFLGSFWLLSELLPPLYTTYKFTEEGIEVFTLCGLIRVLRIKRQDIQEAKVMSGLRARLENPFATSMTNRIRKRVLLVKTTRGKCYMLTPASLEEALRTIGFDPQQ